MFTWDADGDADDADFVGIHGDEMCGGVDEDAGEEEADRQAEEAAFQPFEPDDFTTPGTGFEVPCPTKLPHDLQVSQNLARWFGPPYNSWYVGSIAEVRLGGRLGGRLAAGELDCPSPSPSSSSIGMGLSTTQSLSAP